MPSLPILGYKRHPRPVIGIGGGEFTDTYKMGAYLDSELQRLENSLDTNGQQTEVLDGGITEVKQTLVSIESTTDANTAAITSEATTRSTADTALASLVTTLTASNIAR